ncbi:DUF2059 domain-containing protein [Marinibacterium profundimaris]|uniref:DUF2059 domain-containing protein n=1 Tax=Marinibacterium profundimaris TaxID=1679460 RepID=A0A225NQY0_9RHOB|nr:DUF2059 domain-containing protein [Marinibacterium profundimaris]OWU77283.1 hypothetical protein ATO3_00670 [Marinibacterium profundimaris]
MTALLRTPARWLGAAFVALALSASSAAAADRERVEAFLEVTGFDVSLESLKFSAEDAPEMLGLDAGVFGYSWTRLSGEVFDVDLMHDMAVDILEQTLEDDKLAHAADFYASDLGQRLVEVENASHMDPDDTGKQEKGAELVAQMVEEGSPRLEMFKRMGAAIDSSGTAVRAMQQIQMRFLLAASAAGVIELRVDPEEMEAMMKEQEPALRMAVAQNALASSAYVYRDFSDEEVETYTEALEHPDMQEVYELMNAVQYEIMANRFEALAARMSELDTGQDI